MKKPLLSIVFIILASASQAQLPAWQWANGIGSSINPDYPRAIVMDAAENSYITGSFAGPTDFDPGPGVYTLTPFNPNVFVTKQDSLGNMLWAIQVGGKYDDQGYSIALDDMGNVIVAGHFNDTADFDPGPGVVNRVSLGGPDIFVMKLTSSGSLIWVNTFGNQGDDVSQQVICDKSGNIYLTGLFSDTIDFDPGPGIRTLISDGYYDGYVVRFNSSGMLDWAFKIGSVDWDNAYGIAVQNGHVYVTGDYYGTVDFDPGPSTYTFTSDTNASDVYICKYDTSGHFIWARSIGGTAFELVSSIAVDSLENVYTAGMLSGASDFDPGSGTYILNAPQQSAFVSRLDAAGDFVWAKIIQSTGEVWAHDIAVRNGLVYCTGRFSGTADFNPDTVTVYSVSAGLEDVFVCALDSTGRFIWRITAGNISSEEGYDLDVNDSGVVALAGIYRSPSVTFGPSTIFQIGYDDIFISRLITPVPSGIPDISQFGLNIRFYPNPANDRLTVSLNKLYPRVEVYIRDIAGKTVYSTNVSFTQTVELNTSGLANGLYFVEVRIGDNKAIGKVLLSD